MNLPVAHTGNYKRIRFAAAIVFTELLLMMFSGVSFSQLNEAAFFSFEADPLYWIIFGLKIPQTIIQHLWIGVIADILVLLLLILFLRNPGSNKIVWILMPLLLILYMTITGYLAHRNFQAGYVWFFFPFLFAKTVNRNFAYEATRYFLLFFYVSAAVLKLSNNLSFSPAHFSDFLVNQFSPYFLESNTGWRTDLNLFLIQHKSFSGFLYVSSIVIELLALVGFFTKKYDRWIAFLLYAFHFTNWIIMDIAPIGQLGFLALLFCWESDFAGKSKRSNIEFQ